MSILAIGQSSFLANAAKKAYLSKGWTFIGHADAFEDSLWPKGVKTVIGFVCDPCVRKGQFSDFDRRLAQKASESGASYIMLSSRTVYGTSNNAMIYNENFIIESVTTPYGLAKRAIEQDLLENFDNVTILRLSNVFGFEYDPANPRQTFFGAMLKSLKEEGVIRFNMAAETERDFLPVDKFVEYLGIIAANPQAGIFNIGAGFGTKAGDIADAVIHGYGSGERLITDNQIKDSFILDMKKSGFSYALNDVKAEDVMQSCLSIGKKLKAIE